MALIECPKCGRQVSDKAALCPKCGHRIAPITSSASNRRYGSKSLSIIIATVIIAFAATLIWYFSDNKINTSSSTSPGYSSKYSYSSQPKTGREGALAQAKSYLSYLGFSYSGLIEQLEYEGFSSTEARYGADNCGVDWKDQALKKAKSYSESLSFSYSSLLEQLEYEGFSSTEAKYGVDNCGANWNEQAAKKAKSYLESMTFTLSDLYDQLIYEGFTSTQASYGVNHCGHSW